MESVVRAKRGFDPRKVSTDQLQQKMLMDTDDDKGEIGVCAKGALKVLINLGFILTCSLEDEAFIIIDEKESNLFFVNWI